MLCSEQISNTWIIIRVQCFLRYSCLVFFVSLYNIGIEIYLGLNFNAYRIIEMNQNKCVEISRIGATDSTQTLEGDIRFIGRKIVH